MPAEGEQTGFVDEPLIVSATCFAQPASAEATQELAEFALPPTKIVGGEIIRTKQDLRVVGRALVDRWPTTPERRAIIMDRLYEIVTDPRSKPRDINQSARVLIAADKINLDHEPKQVQHVEHHHTLTLEERKEALRERILSLSMEGTTIESGGTAGSAGERRG